MSSYIAIYKAFSEIAGVGIKRVLDGADAMALAAAAHGLQFGLYRFRQKFDGRIMDRRTVAEASISHVSRNIVEIFVENAI